MVDSKENYKFDLGVKGFGVNFKISFIALQRDFLVNFSLLVLSHIEIKFNKTLALNTLFYKRN